jgi:hypothetical protein
MLQGVDINRYAYAGNDPVNMSDPNGHYSGFFVRGKQRGRFPLIATFTLHPTEG